MEPHNDGWLYSGSAYERLSNKSVIGRRIGDKLLLSPAEVIFCHNHRHIDWPYDNWFEEEITKNPDLIDDIFFYSGIFFFPIDKFAQKPP